MVDVIVLYVHYYQPPICVNRPDDFLVFLYWPQIVGVVTIVGPIVWSSHFNVIAAMSAPEIFHERNQSYLNAIGHICEIYAYKQ